jgi:hypothetical protein
MLRTVYYCSHKQLREATALKDMPALTGLLARATEMGLVGEELDAAREVHKEISVKQTALRDLAGATQVHNSVVLIMRVTCTGHQHFSTASSDHNCM